jgi:RNA polymerase sigma factor for flagellar operon FliA
VSTPRSLVVSLWERWHKHHDVEARRTLLDQHLGLVHHVARQVAHNLPAEVEFDDLTSAGTLGLVRALEAFDPDRGLEFSTYATPRIRGAILDELREQDWVPRSVRQKHRRVRDAVRRLEHRLERSPDPAQIAEELEIDLPTYWRWLGEIDQSVLVPMQAPSPAYSGMHGLDETLADPDAPVVGAALEREEDGASLEQALRTLPPNESTVLALYYYEELTLRQIGEVLHLTESRVSQIRTRALRRLRSRMGAPAGAP